MNSYVQVIGDRTIGLEWRTQRGVIDSESRLESRWGQKWRKLIASQRIWIIYWKQWGAMEGFWEEDWQEGEQGDWDGYNVCCRQGRQCEECKCGNGMVLRVSMTVSQQVWPWNVMRGGRCQPAIYWNHRWSIKQRSTSFTAKLSGLGPWASLLLKLCTWFQYGARTESGVRRNWKGRLGLAFETLNLVAVPRFFVCKPQNLILTY